VKALRWHGAGDVRVEQLAEPNPAPGMTLIEVRYCGICGTDLGEYRDGPHLISRSPHPLTGREPPITLGHEFSGAVLDTGDDSGVRVGQRVTADACWRCGRCSACAAGDYHLCRHGGSIGLHSDGAFAARVLVPDYCVVALGDRVSDTDGAMVEPFAVALHALERGALAAGEIVVVLGFGPIGAAAATLAGSLGARPIVVEKSPARLELAQELGFQVLEAGESLPRRVRKAAGDGGANLVIESTGVAAVLTEAIECTRRGGRIVLVGLTSVAASIQVDRLVLYERSVLGSLGYRGHLPAVVRMIEDGLVEPGRLLSGVVSLDDAPATIAEMSSDPGKRIKVLVDLDG
jgi:(R,R)-butanediol dehydrogenase/meso-butanediol dehydrogenase/diacetyl reductase